MWRVVFLLWLSGGSFAFEEVQIGNGLSLVEVPWAEEGRSVSDGSLVSNFRSFLAKHELKVKLDEILPRSEDVQRNLKGALDYLNGFETDEDEIGRKGGGGLGGKKGGGAILMMATMMGGTMAALGFGAVAMLAMKALTVSAMALMLSAAIGLKKLLSKGDDEGGHSVSYIPVHHGGGSGHHRRRRSVADLVYSAYYVPTSIT